MIRAHVRAEFDFLPAIASGLQPAVDGLIAHELAQAREEAKADAPVVTGALRDSIVVERFFREGFALVAGVAYAIFVELGTRLMPAHPFLQPAFNRALTRVAQKLPAVLGRLGR